MIRIAIVAATIIALVFAAVGVNFAGAATYEVLPDLSEMYIPDTDRAGYLDYDYSQDMWPNLDVEYYAFDCDDSCEG